MSKVSGRYLLSTQRDVRSVSCVCVCGDKSSNVGEACGSDDVLHQDPSISSLFGPLAPRATGSLCWTFNLAGAVGGRVEGTVGHRKVIKNIFTCQNPFTPHAREVFSNSSACSRERPSEQQGVKDEYKAMKQSSCSRRLAGCVWCLEFCAVWNVLNLSHPTLLWMIYGLLCDSNFCWDCNCFPL